MKTRNFDIDAAHKLLDEKPIGQLLAEGLQEIADELKKDKKGIGAKFTCHKVSLDLIPTAYNPALVKKTRKILDCSQALFAQFLNVSISTVRNWEQGVNVPQDAACRLMDEIRHNPTYWRKRLRELTVPKKPRTVQ
ncbi:MAG TPA: hypothetical protein VMR25_12155 [Planctomycetaceae bacterium]|jgi:putative transcriptional regulator|nr:hypothetical protein [Planctomycetaceae bacterium]